MSPTPRPSLTPAAVVDNFSVSFAGRQVLHNLNLELPAHRLTVIIGPSGSGKTTFLRGFNRLNECFPRCQTRGGIRLRVAEGWWEIYGKDLPLTELRRRVGMVFQAPNVLPLSIARNISLPLDLVLGWPRRDLSARVEWALQQTHLWEEVQDRLDAPAATLSGGQQQRLCLARALALGPDLLMLDEPTASLDFRAALKIEELITHLKERYTILAVSHSLRQARRLADQILVFKEGAIVRTLKREEIQQPGIFHHLVEEIF